MPTFTGTSAIDTFFGADDKVDAFKFAADFLTGEDTINGGKNASDRLEFITAGDISQTDLANVSGIETIKLFSGVTIDLTSKMALTAASHIITINDSIGNNIVYAYSLADPSARLYFNASSGDDIYSGSSGVDIVTIPLGQLNGRDFFSGGAGTDILKLTLEIPPGHYISAKISNETLANVFSFETIQFPDWLQGSISVSQQMVGSTAKGVLTIYGPVGDFDVDASAVEAGRVVFHSRSAVMGNFIGGAGKDVFYGGHDTFEFVNSGKGSDVINFNIEEAYDKVLSFSSLDQIDAPDRVNINLDDWNNEYARNSLFFSFNKSEFSVDNHIKNINAPFLDNGSSMPSDLDGYASIVFDGPENGKFIRSASAADKYMFNTHRSASSQGDGSFLITRNIDDTISIFYDPDVSHVGDILYVAKIEGYNLSPLIDPPNLVWSSLV